MNIKKITLIYFYLFLVLDLANGFVIRYLGLNPILSPGQITRSIILIILTINFLSPNRITKNNMYILLFIAVFPVASIFYLIRDGLMHSMAIEIIWFAKPLFFLLLLDVVYRNKYFFREKLSSIMKINLFIYVMPIIFSFITGVGLSNYDEFYVSTKSFFYGNNVTSITGFTLCIYFAYQLKSSKVNYIYFILAFISLFISGGKIILLVPFLTLLIYVYNKKRNNIRSILIGSVLLLLTSLFMIGFLDSSIFINNAFTEKYYSRTFKEGLSIINARQNINIIPLNWYSYASYSRATRANTGLNAIIDNPINLFFGYGTSMTSKIVGGRYDRVGNSEMDFIDIFLTYGLLGFLLIYIPIMKIIIPLLFKREFGVIAMIIYLLFIYSSLAGHVITAPMAGSLFALFLGLGGNLKNNKLNNIRLQRKIQLVKAI